MENDGSRTSDIDPGIPGLDLTVANVTGGDIYATFDSRWHWEHSGLGAQLIPVGRSNFVGRPWNTPDNSGVIYFSISPETGFNTSLQFRCPFFGSNTLTPVDGIPLGFGGMEWNPRLSPLTVLIGIVLTA
jgi:hypothetical protein